MASTLGWRRPVEQFVRHPLSDKAGCSTEGAAFVGTVQSAHLPDSKFK